MVSRDRPHVVKTPQSEHFVKIARSIEADEDEEHWEERLRKIAAHKPAVAPPIAEEPIDEQR